MSKTRQNPMRTTRELLRMTQSKMAQAIGISRGLWSVHEGKGPDHDVLPRIARALIAYARTQNVPLTYEHFYDGLEFPNVKVTYTMPKVKREAPVEPITARPRRRVIVSDTSQVA